MHLFVWPCWVLAAASRTFFVALCRSLLWFMDSLAVVHGHWSARAQLLHSMWDLSLLTRDRTHVPRVATRILNH